MNIEDFKNFLLEKSTAVHQFHDPISAGEIAGYEANEAVLRSLFYHEELKDVRYDFENAEIDIIPKFTGFLTVNGHACFAAAVGGDWESPVGIILYEKDGKLQWYIPTKGNTFNIANKDADGSRKALPNKMFKEFVEHMNT